MILRAAIIGCGNIAGGYDEDGKKGDYYSHIKSYQANKQVKVTAVFDTNEVIVKKFASYWNIESAYTDLRLMLQEAKPAIVSICSPNTFHCEQVRQCVDAGVKTILCEKPLSYKLREAEETIAYAQKRGVALVINYLRNWDKEFLALENMLQNTPAGDLESVHVNYNKGVFHNASHFINFFLRSLGSTTGKLTIFNKEKTGSDAYADFLMNFEKCNNVCFFNHRQLNSLITEMEFFFKTKRIKIERGGALFITEDYSTGKKIKKKGSIHTCMKQVIDDVVMQTKKGAQKECWSKNLADTIETTKICEQIVTV